MASKCFLFFSYHYDARSNKHQKRIRCLRQQAGVSNRSATEMCHDDAIVSVQTESAIINTNEITLR